MKRLFRLVGIAMLSLALSVPPLEAQNHGGGNNTTTGQRNGGGSHQRGNDKNGGGRRPVENSHGNKGGGHDRRPGNRPNNNRPNNNRPNGNRPNDRPNDHRPGNNRPNDHRPGNRPGNNRPNDRPNDHRPGNRPGDRPNHRPNNPVRPNHRPGNGFGPNGIGWNPGPRPPHRPPVMRPPHRPHRPVVRPWHRPVPPPAWRPRPGGPSIGAVLGLTFGTAINLSLNYLLSNGYAVDGYDSDVVYLRNVNEMSYYWPDATLYYGPGGLVRSQFIYSTAYPDPMRYNSLFNTLVASFGAPVVNSASGASWSSTWFSPSRGYITIEYSPQYSLGGATRFFTTLSIGM